MPRRSPGPVQRRSSKDRALRYIQWAPVDPSDAAGEPAPIEDRALHIDLSRWATWAEEMLEQGRSIEELSTEQALYALDPEFDAPLHGVELERAAARLRALWQAWTRASVPVLRASLDGPEDVLEVFTRINLGGVQVAGDDVFFAAVKTFWPEAEE